MDQKFDVRVGGDEINRGGVDRIRCAAKESNSTVGDILDVPGISEIQQSLSMSLMIE